MRAVPEIRLRACNALSVREDGSYVLYWMIACRRLEWNFALDRAVEWSERLRKPLVILEALRCGCRWASERIHSFILDGMADNARRLERSGVLHYPYCEFERDAGRGLLYAMAAKASVVVTDDFPCFFLPHMVTTAASRLTVKMEAVDSNGLLPMRTADRAFPTAYSFRRFLQRNLRSHLTESPRTDSIGRVRFPATARLIPSEARSRWPVLSQKLLQGERRFLAKMPIDHKTRSVAARGGATAARTVLRRFLRDKLDNYSHVRNEPEQDATSGLSPYLHFGHISAHQIFSEVAKHERWGAENISLRANGSRTGWWGVGESAEAFLDQLITWRELGFNFCSQREDYGKFSSLPGWATKTLKRHARDERAHVYTLQEFESTRTHDALWNAAQNQLVREGRMHNYLRMLWGKKILEWSGSPQEALEIMIELNNKYALDGRDPNSYSGIFWCVGRYDRPWGPERPIFGTVRYMSSENTARKFAVKNYIRKYSP